MSRSIGNVVACVFDAYGTLFDVHSAVDQLRDEIGPEADRLSNTWRAKQLQYTWLRSLMHAFVPFDQVTGEALDYAMADVGCADSELREKLMQLYYVLDCYPEVPLVLRTLRGAGIKTAILSNGSREMLAAAVAHAGIEADLDAVLSVDEVGVYKVDPRVYALATARYECAPEEICFLSSNAWDAWAASHFGFRVAWVNRFRQPPERLPGSPTAEIETLDALPELLRI